MPAIQIEPNSKQNVANIALVAGCDAVMFSSYYFSKFLAWPLHFLNAAAFGSESQATARRKPLYLPSDPPAQRHGACPIASLGRTPCHHFFYSLLGEIVSELGCWKRFLFGRIREATEYSGWRPPQQSRRQLCCRLQERARSSGLTPPLAGRCADY